MSSISTAVAKEVHFMVPTRPSWSSEHSQIDEKAAAMIVQTVRRRENRFTSECLVGVAIHQTPLYAFSAAIISTHIGLPPTIDWALSSITIIMCHDDYTTPQEPPLPETKRSTLHSRRTRDKHHSKHRAKDVHEAFNVSRDLLVVLGQQKRQAIQTEEGGSNGNAPETETIEQCCPRTFG